MPNQTDTLDDDYDLDEDELEDESDESDEVAEPAAPPPPPSPKFIPEDHAALTEEQEQQKLAKYQPKKPGRKPKVTDPVESALAREKDQLSEDEQALKAKEEDAEEEKRLESTNFELDSEVKGWLKGNRKARYRAIWNLSKRAKSEAVVLRCLQMLENRDLGRPGTAAQTESDDEPGAVVL